MKIKKGIPKAIIELARTYTEAHKRGEKVGKLIRENGKGLRSVAIKRRYRLVITKTGKSELMTHEAYNSRISYR